MKLLIKNQSCLGVWPAASIGRRALLSLKCLLCVAIVCGVIEVGWSETGKSGIEGANKKAEAANRKAKHSRPEKVRIKPGNNQVLAGRNDPLGSAASCIQPPDSTRLDAETGAQERTSDQAAFADDRAETSTAGPVPESESSSTSSPDKLRLSMMSEEKLDSDHQISRKCERAVGSFPLHETCAGSGAVQARSRNCRPGSGEQGTGSH